MNPSFVIDRTGVHGVVGRIYMFVAAFKLNANWSSNSTEQADCVYTYSDNDGVTWSSLVSIKSAWDLSDYEFAIPAPNNGIQMKNGSLAIPMFVKGSRSGAIIKDVGGEWRFTIR